MVWFWHTSFTSGLYHLLTWQRSSEQHICFHACPLRRVCTSKQTAVDTFLLPCTLKTALEGQCIWLDDWLTGCLLFLKAELLLFLPLPYFHALLPSRKSWPGPSPILDLQEGIVAGLSAHLTNMSSSQHPTPWLASGGSLSQHFIKSRSRENRWTGEMNREKLSVLPALRFALCLYFLGFGSAEFSQLQS